MIRLSEKTEKDNFIIRDMWRRIFEDPDEYLDFYFDTIMKDNKVILYDHGDSTIGMLHMNPYSFSNGKSRINTYFIVAVCVEEGFRRNGYMKELMEKAFDIAAKEGCEFIYLWPANEAYYSGMGYEKLTSLCKLEIDKSVLAELLSSDRNESACKNELLYSTTFNEKRNYLEKEANAEGGQFIHKETENEFAEFMINYYEETCVINHVSFSNSLLFMDSLSEQLPAIYGERIVISIDDRLLDMLKMSIPKIINYATADHIYMIKRFHDNKADIISKILFTEIV